MRRERKGKGYDNIGRMEWGRVEKKGKERKWVVRVKRGVSNNTKWRRETEFSNMEGIGKKDKELED